MNKKANEEHWGTKRKTMKKTEISYKRASEQNIK